MARDTDFIPLNAVELAAVVGPASRHIALVEDAF